MVLVHSEVKGEPPTLTYLRSVTWHSRLFAAMLVAAIVVVTGCASSDEASSFSGQGEQQETSEEASSLSPEGAMRLAYEATAQARTAKVDVDIALSGLPTGATASSGQSSGTTTLDISGQGVIDLEKKANHLVLQTPSGELEARQIGNTLYEKLPEGLGMTSEQKPWVKFDLDPVTRQQPGTSFPQLQGNSPTDPSEQLGYLQGVSDSVEEVGNEEVRGAAATHYRIAVDLEKAAEQQEGTQARQAYDELEQRLGTSTLPMDVWLDEKGRVVRLKMDVPTMGSSSQYASGQGSSDQEQAVVTEEFYDFGTPVNIEPPPADQVTYFDSDQ